MSHFHQLLVPKTLTRYHTVHSIKPTLTQTSVPINKQTFALHIYSTATPHTQISIESIHSHTLCTTSLPSTQSQIAQSQKACKDFPQNTNAHKWNLLSLLCYFFKRKNKKAKLFSDESRKMKGLSDSKSETVSSS